MDLVGSVVGFSYLLQEPVSEALPLPLIEEILVSEAYLAASEKQQYLLAKCALSDEARREILSRQEVKRVPPTGWLRESMG